MRTNRKPRRGLGNAASMPSAVLLLGLLHVDLPDSSVKCEIEISPLPDGNEVTQRGSGDIANLTAVWGSSDAPSLPSAFLRVATPGQR